MFNDRFIGIYRYKTQPIPPPPESPQIHLTEAEPFIPTRQHGTIEVWVGLLASLGSATVETNVSWGGGFKYVLFSSLFGEMIQFGSCFSDGLKPPTS